MESDYQMHSDCRSTQIWNVLERNVGLLEDDGWVGVAEECVTVAVDAGLEFAQVQLAPLVELLAMVVALADVEDEEEDGVAI